MPLYTADALILRTYKLGEADRIVVFLTRDRGKKRGVAKGARRSRSRFAGALEPLTEARVAYFEKERRELVGLNYAETMRSPLGLIRPAKAGPHGSGMEAGFGRLGDASGVQAGFNRPGDGSGVAAGFNRPGDGSDVAAGFNQPGDVSDVEAGFNRPGDALGYVGYFAELLDEWAQEADADERLFRLGTSMLSALGAGAPVESLARYFEYWLLRLQGVYPESRGTLSLKAVEFLRASRTIGPDRLSEVPADRRTLRELEQLHRGLIAMHLEKTLKSDRVLRDIRRHA